MTVADLAIVAGLVFAWGTLSARLERLDMTAPIVFTVAGVLLTHGLLAPLGITPGGEVVKVLAEATLALVLFSDTLPGRAGPAAGGPGAVPVVCLLGHRAVPLAHRAEGTLSASQQKQGLEERRKPLMTTRGQVLPRGRRRID